MTSRLYPLLPQTHRVRDLENGRQLRALVGVMEEVFATLETDIEGLYDDWFIETCAEWVVPYLGDLLGARPLKPPAVDREGDVAYSLRAYVANTLGYRRRKGTTGVMEQLARDVTGWPARAVEYFELLATTQQLNHLRLHATAVASLRDGDALEHIGTAFDRLARTANVRHIADAGRIPAPDGRHNIPNLGLHLWRLQSYWTAASDARPATAAGCYRFDAIGRDRRLFNRPRTEAGLAERIAELNAPVPLRRRALYDELEALRAALARGEAGSTAFFDAAEPAHPRRAEAAHERALVRVVRQVRDRPGRRQEPVRGLVQEWADVGERNLEDCEHGRRREKSTGGKRPAHLRSTIRSPRRRETRLCSPDSDVGPM